MSDRDEHNAEIDAGYWADEEEEEIYISPKDALDWLADLAEGYVPEEVMEFLLDTIDALKVNAKCPVGVLAADFADKHEREIKSYLK